MKPIQWGLAAIAGLLGVGVAAALPAPCLGDVDGDGDADNTDLQLFVAAMEAVAAADLRMAVAVGAIWCIYALLLQWGFKALRFS